MSSYITLEDGACVGKHPLVPRVMEGTFQEKLQIPKCTDVWQFPFIPSILIPCGDIAHFSACWNLKQSRPGVKNPLVKLEAFDDKTVGVVTTLKEYLTRIHTLRGSESLLFVSYQRPFR